MDHFRSLGYPALQLRILNHCRLYLRVIFLSDIVSADGSVIIPACKQGHQLADRISTLNWPIQPSPPPSAWTLWKQALAHFESNDWLIIPLKQWTGETHQRWRWFSEVSSKKLLHRDDRGNWSCIEQLPPMGLRTTRQVTRPIYNISRRSPFFGTPRGLAPTTMIEGRVRATYTSSPGPPLFPPPIMAPIPSSRIPSWMLSLLTSPLDQIIPSLHGCLYP
jgi:hypothetical protein